MFHCYYIAGVKILRYDYNNCAELLLFDYNNCDELPYLITHTIRGCVARHKGWKEVLRVFVRGGARGVLSGEVREVCVVLGGARGVRCAGRCDRCV